MLKKEIVTRIGLGIGLMLLQILVFQNLIIYSRAFCFVYVLFFLMLPVSTNKMFLMALGFAYGITIDIFNDTAGYHAAACVLLAYIRPYIIERMTPQSGYDALEDLTLQNMGTQWFVVYSIILISIHHVSLIMIETASLNMLGYTIIKIISSILYTFVIVLLAQYLLFSSQKTR